MNGGVNHDVDVACICLNGGVLGGVNCGVDDPV